MRIPPLCIRLINTLKKIQPKYSCTKIDSEILGKAATSAKFPQERITGTYY